MTAFLPHDEEPRAATLRRRATSTVRFDAEANTDALTACTLAAAIRIIASRERRTDSDWR